MCADFRSSLAPLEPLPFVEYGTYHGANITSGNSTFGHTTFGEYGALVTFDSRPNPSDGTVSILARIGVSLLSKERACVNAEEEIPDFDFDRVRETARETWNELLGRFEVDADESQRDAAVLLYSSVSFVIHCWYVLTIMADLSFSHRSRRL